MEIPTANYKRFNRHESMSKEVRDEIREILNIHLWGDNIEQKDRWSIENSLYGLYDGYLYDSLLTKAEKFPEPVRSKIIKVWNICNEYPQSNSQIH